MLVLLIDKDGYERAFNFNEGKLTRYFTGVYAVEVCTGRDIDGDYTYHKDFGTILPKGTIKQWTGSDLLPNSGYREFDETKSYKV